MAVKYLQVTFCRIATQTSSSAGANWDPNTYVPPRTDSSGNIISTAQNSPPTNNNTSSNIVIQDIPGDSVIDLYSIKQFNRYYNTQTNAYENNVLEILVDGVTTKYIRMTDSTLKTHLINLNTP